jgi:putative phosphoserine phosphatase / 1-acylglycerol-3-phosphate O-acyltransferase
VPGAAFFDLDRTLLKGASGPLLMQALVDAGVLPDRHYPGEGLVYRFYELAGETLVGMALARQIANVFSGIDPESVRAAAKIAADELSGRVLPYVHPLVDEHHREGRKVVLATTTPHDLVGPFAEKLGFDDVVATRYVIENGRYTGALDGNFVWFLGKLDAVRKWADGHGVAVADSWAYSDSVFDAPLLSAVAHPYAVNPDPRLRVLALARRWPVLFLDVPPGVPKLLGVEPFDVIRLLARPELFPYARFDIDGVENIPRDGPAIVVANHRSYFDTAAIGITVARSGRPVRFLGKKEVFDAPIVGQLARALGGIRVERGSGSDRPLVEAERALRAGDLVALMPQGTIPRGRAFFDTELRGRPGAARLAGATGAPMVPIGLWGTEQVWPRSARVPNVTNVVHPPTVRVRVGPPFRLGASEVAGDVAASTARIMAALSDLLPPEAHEAREPTAEELARSVPPGHAVE